MVPEKKSHFINLMSWLKGSLLDVLYDTLESNSLSLVESPLWVQQRGGVRLSQVDRGEEKIIGVAT